jgi:hypothetical protein
MAFRVCRIVRVCSIKGPFYFIYVYYDKKQAERDEAVRRGAPLKA